MNPESCTNPRVQSINLEGRLVLCPFSKVRVIGSPLEPGSSPAWVLGQIYSTRNVEWALIQTESIWSVPAVCAISALVGVSCHSGGCCSSQGSQLLYCDEPQPQQPTRQLSDPMKTSQEGRSFLTGTNSISPHPIDLFSDRVLPSNSSR